ncbi:MAG: hypothetical protein L0H83_07310 [Salinisphaera sp.]|nr:hypothetical protein [Salinisphaera sp.]
MTFDAATLRDPKGRTLRHSVLGTSGELTAELHYGDFQTGHGRQAALFIWRRAHYDDGVFIPLSQMWMFGHNSKLQAEAFATMIPELTAQLYSGLVIKSDMIRVFDLILDYLDELRRSPPDPALWRDKSFSAWLESLADEGLELANGKMH